MSQGKPASDTRKEQQWHAAGSAEWQHSGLTIRAFCERHQPVPNPASTPGVSRRFSNAMPSPVLLVSVQLVPDDEPVAASIVEVVLPGGPTLRVPPRFDAASLRQLLLVLQEGCSC